MITLHYLSNSHSHVVLWLLEELGIDCNIIKHQRTAQGRSPDTLAAVHPLAKAPTIEDRGITMVESTGILLYLLESYGGGRLRPPPNTPDAMRFYQWITFIGGSALAALSGKAMVMFTGCEDEALNQLVSDNAKRPLTFIDQSLEGQDYLVKGFFTAADIQLGFCAASLETFGELDSYPNIEAHLKRMRARDAYKAAEEKGGPLALVDLMKRLGLDR